MWEEHISSLRAAKFRGHQISPSSQLDLASTNGHSRSLIVDRLSQKCTTENISGSCSTSKEENEIVDSLQQSDTMDMKKSFILKNPWVDPNKLSEEMVRCMREIFICLAESSSTSKASSSESLPSSFSPVGHLSWSSLTSFSDSSIMPSSMQSPTSEFNYTCEELDRENSFNLYSVNGKVNCINFGSYGLATEVCWMSVGKKQLDYAAEALKKFRFLVEQLTQVNPAQMSNSEKLAFWINLYNALIMHAYLAYGVPKSDIKLFYLMQKASYTIGGQSFNAADIEFVLLKMKPPAHRPQIGLVLALHKFKISEEHRKYSIDSPEPLVLFALSSGMYSSPAVRIFTPDNVQDELKKSMKDYVRASIGIGDGGKLLVPKLLHCFARSVVEDSLLVDWICRYLTPDQVTIVRDSTSQKKQRLLGVRSFSIVPFDSRFRYLFLPEKEISQDSC
ncbi:uncharacterized protein M6B38_376045 [Iris pallida]|uniref:DUF547 domain-containing protein n=1 Tax=Iris pallida TaxID=29817 RepID=A0AAX6GB03_IRIPA|nr:uncharacterized protein M6B38_376045 [Iris pallida]